MRPKIFDQLSILGCVLPSPGKGMLVHVSPSAWIDVWRILVSSILLVYDGNRFLRFLY
jgi:hypothetical protein